MKIRPIAILAALGASVGISATFLTGYATGLRDGSAKQVVEVHVLPGGMVCAATHDRLICPPAPAKPRNAAL